MASMARIGTPWSREGEAVLEAYASDSVAGLQSREAERRLQEYGENRITQSHTITFPGILKEELKEPLILLLLGIGGIYSVWGNLEDTITILMVVVTVTLVEVFTEYRAKKSIESLRKLSRPTTWVIRDGKPVEIATGLIVPGDVLILKNGIRIGADARIVCAHGLETDESQLTGEAMGVRKNASPIPADASLNDRSDMVHMGGVILKGKGTAVVVATGMDTELGRIAGLTQEARDPKTPLQKSMKELSKSLIWIAVVFSVAIPVLGLLQGKPFREMLLTGLSLSFAAIPEEMPIIVTMLLGLGSIRLSGNKVLLRRTKAAETLGSVTVIATDKTGTLTENKMRIESWAAPDERRLFAAAALMADIVFDDGQEQGDKGEEDLGAFLGDPMDKAVAEKARELGIDHSALLREFVVESEPRFDETRMIFEAVYSSGGKRISLAKGAPESLFDMSAPDGELRHELEKAAAKGYRTIAVAEKDETETRYRLLGIVCFDDPIRPGVRKAIADCAAAGVRVVMITGDHAATARRVAEEAGILPLPPSDAPPERVVTGPEMAAMTKAELKEAVRRCTVFARISPEQKLRLVEALRDNAEVVAVTGDGINDAPALKAADIGISMGISGTDVAKETADMILMDDSFTSIVGAIDEGRRLYGNLAKCVKYYLACKVGLIVSLLIPTIFNLPMPFSPVQIIILELFMDLAASTSFVVEPAESDLLKRGPRDPAEPFMNGAMLRGIFSGGLTLAALVLAVHLYFWFSTGDATLAGTGAFVAWLLGHVCLAFNMRTDTVPLGEIGVFSSKAFDLWMIGVVAFLGLALEIPGLGRYLNLAPLGAGRIAAIALAALAASSWIELGKRRSRRKGLSPGA